MINLSSFFWFQEKAVTQKVELNESIVRANDTIQQMGLMYLKLKDFKD